ncbi:MAG: hypothetical protein H6734_14000 [Alphaproteobacteria bacterium]|nr:hypothetical protein [Alphaproteobacteria bacterium]
MITWDEPSGVFLEDRQRLTGHGSTPTPISTQSNSAIQAEATGYFGHPSFIVPVLSPFTCMSTNGASVENGFSPAPAPGRTMFTEFRTDHNATTNYVRTKLDATSGQSGSGLVNCPGGCSTSGGGEELVGIFVAGWNELGTFRTGGPKWTRFSAFVAAQ